MYYVWSTIILELTGNYLLTNNQQLTLVCISVDLIKIWSQFIWTLSPIWYFKVLYKDVLNSLAF